MSPSPLVPHRPPPLAPATRPQVIQGFFAGSRPCAVIQPYRPGAAQPAIRGFATQISPGMLQLRPHATGQRLPEALQRKMGELLKTDFSDVRVHVGNEATAIGALAFTHGSDLYFAHGQYNPMSVHGQRLIAHELTHVVQQRAGRVRNPFGTGVAAVQDPALEAEAERIGALSASPGSPRPVDPNSSFVQPVGLPSVPRVAGARGSIQQMKITEHNEALIMIMRFLGGEWSPQDNPHAKLNREPLKALRNWRLVSKKFYALSKDNSFAWSLIGRPTDFQNILPVQAKAYLKVLENYPCAVKPILYGGHVDEGVTGINFSATVLAVMVDGKILTMKLEEKTPLQQIKDIDLSSATERTQKCEIYAKVLVVNQSGKYRDYQNDSMGVVKLDPSRKKYQDITVENFVESILNKIKIPQAYKDLYDLEHEASTFGHTEQTATTSVSWSILIRDLLNHAREALLGRSNNVREVTLLLNRSPCEACAKYLVAELNNFWKLLIKNLYLNLTERECRDKFSHVFSFTIAYTSRNKVKKKKWDATHEIVISALKEAGWKIDSTFLKGNELKPEKSTKSCIDTVQTKTKSKAKSKNNKRKRDSDDEYVPSDEEEDF